MRIANQSGRAVIVVYDRVVDIEQASKGRFGPDLPALYEQWEEFRQWAASSQLTPTGPLRDADIEAPSPRPPQVFGIGINYRKHAAEAGWPVPETPLTFTKFPSSVTGPTGDIELSGPRVDWEVELVVVIGRRAHKVAAAEAWDYVAGLTLGQDISDRDIQNLPASGPQYSLGKSLPGYAPTGPVLATLDEFADPNNIELACAIGDEEMQRGYTDDLVFPVPELIQYLSGLVTLLPGDLIFTGTPSGVGVAMSPPQFLTHGDVVTTTAPEIGVMRHRFVAPRKD